MVRHICLVILALSFAVVTGCHVGCCSKRASEKKCPTDVRKTHCWCFGEDALFRYPCGPNRVYYGHKATCWREWPSSGSEWRDVHCGPPIAAGHSPYDAPLDSPPLATPPLPSPANNEIPNPFRGDADQMPPAPEAQSPPFTETGAAEPNAIPPQPEGEFAPQRAPQGAEGEPAEPMPAVPMSSSYFPPMADVPSGSQPEFRAWSASAQSGMMLVQSQDATAGERVVPTVDVTAPAAVEPTSSLVTDQSVPDSGDGSQWRLVIHDQVEGAAASNRDAALFRPPQLNGSQAPAATTWYPKDAKPSLEERTGAALRRFMSWDMPPGETR